ncbi:hypothetical protein [Chondrinema litorale]|uniref:hypothetical protein n=1 Tax=Chondrinema litorale TaxID=2994555 RepID=UPI00254291B9|nr:hypothetical protein [Chondrinema litorale]UZR95731.1 hypothetical protein OQ292_07890 [Chondrinema litorale]
MRSIRFFILFLTIAFFCNSCFEIREEITINKDGQGTYKMLMDFSASKKMFQMMLDMANTKEGSAVGLEDNPLSGLDSAFTVLSKELNRIAGISDANGIKDEENFQFGLQLNYESVEALNKALSKLDEGNTNVSGADYYIYDKKGRLEKTNSFNLNNLTSEMVPKDDDGSNKELNAQLQTLYDDVTYTMIIETVDAKIRNYSNEEAILSDDKMTLTFSKTLKELKGNVGLANSIRFR